LEKNFFGCCEEIIASGIKVIREVLKNKGSSSKRRKLS